MSPLNTSARQMSCRPTLSVDVSKRKASNKQSNKMISKHNWHFHQHMRTHSAHEFNVQSYTVIPPPPWSWQEIRDNIKRPSPIHEWIIIFLQSKWPTSKFSTFSGVWGEVSERIWIQINNYAPDNCDPVNLELAEEIGLSVSSSFHCIRHAPTANLEASTCTPNGSP